MEIWYLIDRLEELLKKGRKLPLVSGTVVDQEEVLEIIHQMRTSLPQELREARRINEEKEAILAQAREDTKSLLDKKELLHRTEEERARIIDLAHRDAEEVRRGADEYALQVLGQLEDQLASVQATVRNGLELLQRRRKEGKSG
ncbi:MAG: hypothetical protein HYX86_03270 [Chloroflexi bacterium]|nr:hypothetical protein [Chloroflexota bacterium]